MQRTSRLISPSRRTIIQGLSGLAIAAGFPRSSWSNAASTPDLMTWLDGFKPGVHSLNHVPTFTRYRLQKIDPRFPDATYASAVKTAWGIMGPSLRAWIGGAFHFPFFYTCSGGHADSGLDTIYRVDIITGDVVVTRPSPLVRPVETEKGIVNVPERDDYLQGHTYASMVAVEQDLLWIGHMPLYSPNLMYFDAAFPNSWIVNFGDRDKDGYPSRRPLPFRLTAGLYTKLPNDTVMAANSRRTFIADKSGRVIQSRESGLGWNGCYHPTLNTVFGIEYAGEIRAVPLDQNYTPHSARWVTRDVQKRWSYGSAIAPFGKKLVIFTGTDRYFIVDPGTGQVAERPNTILTEKYPNLAFNRLFMLREGAYLYIPTDHDRHPVLWITDVS